MTKGAATPTFGITAPAFLSTSPLWSVLSTSCPKHWFQYFGRCFFLEYRSEYVYGQSQHLCLLRIVKIEIVLQHIFCICQICRAVKFYLYWLVCAPPSTASSFENACRFDEFKLSCIQLKFYLAVRRISKSLIFSRYGTFSMQRYIISSKYCI